MVAADDQGRMRPDALRETLARIDGTGDRLCAGRQREHGRLRSAGRDHPDRARARRVGPRRRGVRDLGGRRPVVEVADGRLPRGQFVVDRRAQVAQRAVRLGDRVRPRRRTRTTARCGSAPPTTSRRPAPSATATTGCPSLRVEHADFRCWQRLRSLGRQGIVDLIERDCAHARRMAATLATAPRVSILNEVVLNQVLVRFEGLDGDDDAGDARTREVIEAVQRDGTCWLSGTTWRGRAAMRFSVSGWQTTEDDIDRSAAAILSCLAEVDARVAASR